MGIELNVTVYTHWQCVPSGLDLAAIHVHMSQMMHGACTI